MNEQEILYSIALTRVSGITLAELRELYRYFGSATAIMENRSNLNDASTEMSPRLTRVLSNMSDHLRRAEVELKWDTDNRIEPLTITNPRYPQRLLECPDAPTVLYYRGNADLNKQRIISVIGTRHCTSYGEDIIRRFMQDMRHLCPDVLVMSGLAYGIDINAHRESLRNGIPTIGVLAHGLDQIYPRTHRDTAIEMLKNGGLLTEYMSYTPGAKGNFVQRNRIVAGMADASILVESASKGGGLITMGIARDYHRETFAFPGPVNAEYSKGCNNIIRDNEAALITSAEDFVKAMGWNTDEQLAKAKRDGIERHMFPDLTEDEQKVVTLLQDNNDLQINVIAVKSGLAINKLTSVLFGLEMKGILKMRAGGCYHLL